MTDSSAVPLLAEDLTKRFSRHEVLRGLSLQVDTGNVHGLVGLNGAGKTTLLECALGLQHFSGGRLSVLGMHPAQLYRSRGALAVVFDTPCIQFNLTVRQVLDYARLTCGRAARPAAEVEQLLGIEQYRDFKVRKLSLGNKRRTSIAQALIARPSFVVLDEPFNGLDAGGVEDLLALIRHLNDVEGTTFLLASHQLSYLEPVCSHIAILHHGRVVTGGATDELLAARQATLRLRTGDDAAAMELLRTLDGVHLHEPATGQHQPAQMANGTTLALALSGPTSAEVNRMLVNGGIDVHELVFQRPSLEELFHEITGRVQ